MGAFTLNNLKELIKPINVPRTFGDMRTGKQDEKLLVEVQPIQVIATFLSEIFPTRYVKYVRNADAKNAVNFIGRACLRRTKPSQFRKECKPNDTKIRCLRLMSYQSTKR